MIGFSNGKFSERKGRKGTNAQWFYFLFSHLQDFSPSYTVASYCSKGSLWSSHTLAISLVLEIANITNIMLPGFPFLGPRLLGNGFSNFKMFQVSRVSGAEVF